MRIAGLAPFHAAMAFVIVLQPAPPPASAPVTAPALHPQAPLDADAARMLVHQSHCLGCHGIDKSGTAPALRDVALQYRSARQADSERLLLARLADHGYSSAASPEQNLNLVRWILTLNY